MAVAISPAAPESQQQAASSHTLREDLTHALTMAVRERIDRRSHLKETWLQELTKANGLLSGVFALDKAHRIMCYSIQLSLLLLQRLGVASKSPLAAIATEVKERIGDARYVNRFLQLPLYVEELLRGSPNSDVLTVLGKIMTWANLLYYVTEYPSWLLTLKAKGTSNLWPARRVAFGERCGIWSNRCWAAYIAADLLRQALICRQEQAAAAVATKEKQAKRLRQSVQHRAQLMMTGVADLPLACHWSTERGLGLPDLLVTCLGLYAAVHGFHLKWAHQAHDEDDGDEDEL